MSIHGEIRTRRLRLGWSLKRLADEVSKREGLERALAWQTVQQWEKEGRTAPKRLRLQAVADALGTTIAALHGQPESEGSAPAQPASTDALLAQALEVLGMALARNLPDPVRDDIADALGKLARRHGANRDQRQVLALLTTDTTNTAPAAPSEKQRAAG